MPLNKTSMMEKIKAKTAAVPPVQGDAVAVAAYRDAVFEAMCDGIIEEITTNADVNVTAGSSAGTYKVS